MQNIENLQNLVGRYFVSHWGYDQTNIDFYKVVKATAKSVFVTHVKTIRKFECSSRFEYVAVPGNEVDDLGIRCFGEKEVMRKAVEVFRGDAFIKTKLGVARLWDGQTMMGSSYA